MGVCDIPSHFLAKTLAGRQLTLCSRRLQVDVMALCQQTTLFVVLALFLGLMAYTAQAEELVNLGRKMLQMVPISKPQLQP